jgi:hypothetical protein
MSANIEYKGQPRADHSACVATNVLVTLLCASCFYQNADLVILVCLKFCAAYCYTYLHPLAVKSLW